MRIETFRLWLLAFLVLLMVVLGLWETRRRTGFAGFATFDWRRAKRYGVLTAAFVALGEAPVLILAPLTAPLLLLLLLAPPLAGVVFGPLFCFTDVRQREAEEQYRVRRARNREEAKHMTGVRKTIKLWFGI